MTEFRDRTITKVWIDEMGTYDKVIKEREMFKDAKIGDRVWCWTEGWATISEIVNSKNAYPIEIKYDNNDLQPETMTFCGRYNTDDLNPSVFWRELKIVPPPRPPRKVTKERTIYLNIYEDSIYSHHTKHQALDKGSDHCIEKARPCVVTYEVEE